MALSERPRWLLSWIIFWLGDGVCRVMRIGGWLGYLYPVYNRLMSASAYVQGPYGSGPWIVVEEHLKDARLSQGDTDDR